MNKILLIDGNSLGFASHRTNKLTCGGIETQAIFGFIKSLRNLINIYQGYEPIVLWDGRSWRKDAHADYKANRDKNPKIAAEREGYKAQKPHIAKACALLGVKQVFAKNMEADDLAAILVKKFKGKANIVLITGDRDWLQLVDDDVIWFDPIRDRTVNIHTFEEETGYQTPHAFMEGKCLQGDVSDNVKGVGGIGEKGAEEFIRKYGSIDAFLGTKFEPVDYDKLSKKFKDFYENNNGGHENLAMNRKLIDLNTPERPPVDNLSVTKGSFDKEKFQEFCEKFGFISIYRDLDNWISTFERK